MLNSKCINVIIDSIGPSIILRSIYFIYLFFHGGNRNDLLCIHTNSLYQDQTAVNGIRTVLYRDVKTGSKTTC